MFPRKVRYSISVLLVGLLIPLLPVTAFAATHYVDYHDSLSDQLLTRILQQVFPGDDFKIIRSELKLQPQPEPEAQPEQELESESLPAQEQGQESEQEPESASQPEQKQGSVSRSETKPATKQEQDPQPKPQPQSEPAPASTSTPASTPAPAPAPAPAPSSMPQYEQQMVNLVNQERQQAGLRPLTVDNRLVNLARLKSQDMIDKNYFGHQSATYGSAFAMMKNAGISYRWAGENLAGSKTVDKAHVALMNSSDHRANILKPEFTHIGIGVVQGGPYGMMFTQMFIGVN